MNIAIIIDCWKDTPTTLHHIILSKIFRSTRFVYLNIKKFLSSDLIDVIIISSYDDKDTTPTILNIDKKKFFFLHEEQLIEFLKNNSVKNIYMCGCAWDSCVRDRPLGYLNVYKIINSLNLDISVLVKYNCVKNLDDTYFVKSKNDDWVKTSVKNIFKYYPKC